MNWRYKFRSIDGHRRRVKVLRRGNGNELVRVINKRNSSDSNASRRNRRSRSPGVWNYSERSKRADGRRGLF